MCCKKCTSYSRTIYYYYKFKTNEKNLTKYSYSFQYVTIIRVLSIQYFHYHLVVNGNLKKELLRYPMAVLGISFAVFSTNCLSFMCIRSFLMVLKTKSSSNRTI